MTRSIAVALLAACGGQDPEKPAPTEPPAPTTPQPTTPQPEPTTPEPYVEPLEILSADVHAPDSPDVYLVQQVDVSTNLAANLTLSVTGPDGLPRTIAFAASATDQSLPLVGLLADTDYTVDITATGLDGQTATSPGHAVHTGGLPPTFPVVDVLTVDTARLEPGWVLANPWSPDLDNVVTVIDVHGRPVWAFHPDHDWRAVTLSDHATLMGLRGNVLIELDFFGNVLREFGSTETAPPGIPIDAEFADLTHECLPEADGSVWTLVGETAKVHDFPLDYTFTTFGDADIEDQIVVHLAADGSTLDRFSMVDLLDEHRLGWDSLDPTPIELLPDWAHGNAVVYDAVDDAVIVSLRHQDTVVKFQRATGQILWILANHDGWAPEFQPYLLTPVGSPFQWQGHQHAPMWLAGDKIVMFDNGNRGRSTPYGTLGTGQFSRVVEFSIDETAMTVSQDWDFWDVPGGKAYSMALGNADLQPTTGDVFATFSYLFEEFGMNNTTGGRGVTSVRTIEFQPATGDVVLDIDWWGDALATPEGWLMDRATRVPTLYGTTATDTATGLE